MTKPAKTKQRTRETGETGDERIKARPDYYTRIDPTISD